MTPHVPQWLTYFQTLGPTFVALIAAGIAWSIQNRQVKVAQSVRDIASTQASIADTKLRLELFEKRYGVFENILAVIQSALNGSKSREELDADLRLASAPVRYLFDISVYGYLRAEVESKIDAYIRAKDAVDELPELSLPCRPAKRR